MEYESSTVALSALGAATSLGGIIQAAAAARAGLVRAQELTSCVHFDEETGTPVPVTGHPAAWLTDGFEETGRLAQLGQAALEDLLATAPQFQRERLDWFLCLPKSVAREAAHRLMQRLQEETGLSPQPHAIHYLLDERGGTAQALVEAAHRLRRRQCDHALILACDSLVDPERTGQLLDTRRLKTADYPVGFMPGEAGVAALLERPDTLRRRGQQPLGLLFEPVTATEPNSFAARAPPGGRALADIITKALARARASETTEGSVYIDLNGESFRATEWGSTLVRARSTTRIENWSQQIPALNFGETGAASPLLALSLAARAFSRSYAPGRHALLLVSSDDGHRAGMVLERPISAQARSRSF